MARLYHVLAQYHEGKWAIEFGDFDRSVVMYELQDYRDHGVRQRDLIIFSCPSDQASINACIAKLNGGQRG